MSNFTNMTTNVVQLVLDNIDNEDGLVEALAAITKNPYITWAKFTLTDNEPNQNKQRVPEEEFENLIKSGVHMPIKMAEGAIAEGHDYSSPIGVITHLTKFKNRIVGLAALWNSERPDDVNIIKEKFNKKEPLNLSWELAYSDSKETSGITDLLNVSLKAATLVGLPAYAGRTQITAVAADQTQGDKVLDELEKVKSELEEVRKDKDELTTKLSLLEASAAQKDTELEELRSFKSAIDAAKEKEEALSSIKEKFSQAGIKKEDSYFDEKAEILLGLSAEALEFFIQETVAFASEKEEAKTEEEASTKQIPNFVAEDNTAVDYKELAKTLRESK